MVVENQFDFGKRWDLMVYGILHVQSHGQKVINVHKILQMEN
jgi:hypothetical protein